MRKGWSWRLIYGPVPENQLKGIFRALDKDGDGKISRKELKMGLKRYEMRFAGFKAWRAIHHVDANGDGMIGEDEIDELIKYVSRWGIIVIPN